MSTRPSIIYGGSVSSDGTNPVEAIREILRNSRAENIPAVASASGQASLQNALERFAASTLDVKIEVGGQLFTAAAAGALGDKNIGFITDFADQLVTNDEEALAKFGEILEQSAARGSRSLANDIFYDAYRAGNVELVAASEFGIETDRTKTFIFSADGTFFGSRAQSNNPAASRAIGELYETRFLLQDDGTRIDVETGRHASYVYFGGRDYFAFINPPEDT
ncbi:MAG: hypothetical protein AAF950_09005 [Pseudomonadota bacterium]